MAAPVIDSGRRPLADAWTGTRSPRYGGCDVAGMTPSSTPPRCMPMTSIRYPGRRFGNLTWIRPLAWGGITTTRSPLVAADTPAETITASPSRRKMVPLTLPMFAHTRSATPGRPGRIRSTTSSPGRRADGLNGPPRHAVASGVSTNRRSPLTPPRTSTCALTSTIWPVTARYRCAATAEPTCRTRPRAADDAAGENTAALYNLRRAMVLTSAAVAPGHRSQHAPVPITSYPAPLFAAPRAH